MWFSVQQMTGLNASAARRLRTMAGSCLTAEDEIHLDAQQSRSQEANRRAVLEKFRKLVLRALVEPKKRKQTRPSLGSQQRRLNGKKRRGEIKKGRAGVYE